MSGAAGTLHRFDSFFHPGIDDSFYTSNPGGESLGAYYQTGTNVWHLFMGQSSTGINGQSVQLVHRFWSNTSLIGDHLFKFGDNPPSSDYYREGYGIGWAFTSNGPNRQAVYRYYNGSTGDHRYDTSSSTPSGYVLEGIAWYSPILVYGCSDPNANNYNGYVNQSSSGCNYTVYGCMDPLASNYNPNANANSGCSYPTPSIAFNISPPTIIQGQSSTLSWSIGNSTSRSLSSVGAIASSGSMVVSPNNDRTYTISAGYYGYTSNSSTKTLVVYTPPSVTLSLDDSTIQVGQSTVLRWSTTGDATTNTIEPGIGASNLNSFQAVSPTVTTTYTAVVSGLGGTDTDQITLVVIPPPEVDISGPISVLYGQSITIQHEQVRATIAYELQIEMTDLDGDIIPEIISLGASASADSTYTHNVPYHNRGPVSITYTLYAVGAGNLTDSKSIVVNIDIDQMPSNISVPESEDKIKNETPIISPDVEITSEQIVIDDIDIPVAIKADAPIQVEIGDSGVYVDVEQI
tara:strand:- start:18433 stop:19986 length:1554 start_codon:yes stop_codon:yes gene_type:complete